MAAWIWWSIMPGSLRWILNKHIVRPARQIIGDYERKRRIKTMPTYTLASDESGDVSMSFGRGASRYFVMAMVNTANPNELRNLMHDWRKEAHLPANYEFKYHSVSSARLRQLVFSALQRADFSIWAILVDKTRLPLAFHEMRRMDFYIYFASELLSTIPFLLFLLCM